MKVKHEENNLKCFRNGHNNESNFLESGDNFQCSQYPKWTQIVCQDSDTLFWIPFAKLACRPIHYLWYEKLEKQLN